MGEVVRPDDAEVRALVAKASAKLHLLSREERRDLEALLAQYEETQARSVAQTDFTSYAESVWPVFIGGKHHRKMADAFERIARGELKRLIISMPPRHCLELDTPVLTPGGWVPMDRLAVGDTVFHPSGAPVEVIGVSDVHRDVELYRVTTNDGASVVTDGGHRWRVRLDRKHGIWNTYTSEELWARDQGATVRRLNRRTTIDWERRVQSPRAAMIPDTEAIDLPEKSLPIDPYVLGVWLGDGSSHHGTIHAHEDDIPHYRAQFHQRGYVTTTRATAQSFGVLGLPLAEMGLQRNKHIPADYLMGSVEQRRDLLRGLMDTDGCIAKHGQCSFTQKDRVLVDQVRELLWSLGIRNTLTASEAKVGDRSYGTAWRIHFYDDDCCSLPRKAERQISSSTGRFIRVEKLDRTGDVKCIEVDHPDHLFVAGKGLIATLNTKSEFGSWLLPSWYMGLYPDRKIIQTSHTALLAEGFGRRVRNLIQSPEYQSIFPGVDLSHDSKASNRWATNYGGTYFALGVGGKVSGMGAHLFIIDDPHSEQEGFNPDSISFEHVYEWYTSGPRQRLQPGGAIVIIMTRWSKKDLAGRVLERAAKDGTLEDWEVIELPAILNEGTDHEESLWPEFWSLEDMQALRSELPPHKWNAQYMQSPTSVDGAIVGRHRWQEWDQKDPPDCHGIIMSWDTAFEKTERSDYSACTIWGIFDREDPDTGQVSANIILLYAFQKRMEFPELKRVAIEMYREWGPDICIVEKKATGSPLLYEMQAIGIPASEFTPTKGKDKVARLHYVSDLFESNLVWATDHRWAQELIEQTEEFPNGDHDDLVDSMTQALLRFRQGGLVRLNTDEPDKRITRKRRAYY